MRQRYHTSLEEGIVYRDVEAIPTPAALHRPEKPRHVDKSRPRRHLIALALVVIFVLRWTVVPALARDSGSPCSTPAHTLASWGIPRILSKVLPHVVSVRKQILWSPRIVAREGQLRSKEVAPGCKNRTVTRASKIVVRSRGWFGRHNSTFTGVAAACIQHALDFSSKGCSGG